MFPVLEKNLLALHGFKGRMTNKNKEYGLFLKIVEMVTQFVNILKTTILYILNG